MSLCGLVRVGNRSERFPCFPLLRAVCGGHFEHWRSLKPAGSSHLCAHGRGSNVPGDAFWSLLVGFRVLGDPPFFLMRLQPGYVNVAVPRSLCSFPPRTACIPGEDFTPHHRHSAQEEPCSASLPGAHAASCFYIRLGDRFLIKD